MFKAIQTLDPLLPIPKNAPKKSTLHAFHNIHQDKKEHMNFSSPPYQSNYNVHHIIIDKLNLVTIVQFNTAFPQN